MSRCQRLWLLSFVAVLAILGVTWQTFSGSLEHLGLVSHDPAELVSGNGDSSSVPFECGHHHHLADLSLPPTALSAEPSFLLATTAPCFSRIAPEPPVSSIERPPQLA